MCGMMAVETQKITSLLSPEISLISIIYGFVYHSSYVY